MDKEQILALKEYGRKVDHFMDILGHSTSEKADAMAEREMNKNCVTILVVAAQALLYKKSVYNLFPKEKPTPEWWKEFDSANLYILPSLVEKATLLREEQPELWESEDVNPNTLQRLKSFFTY